MYELSDTIRARRKELGLTLEILAERVGVTPGALSHIESGRRLPDPRNALAIASALQLDPDELLTLLDGAHSDRRADQVGCARPSARRTITPPRNPDIPDIADIAVPSAMPLDATPADPEDTEGDTTSEIPAVTPPTPAASGLPAAPRVVRQHSNVSAPSPRDRTTRTPASDEHLRAAERLAEEALRAIHTLRGMLDDEDPTLVREARRLLRELGVRGVDD